MNQKLRLLPLRKKHPPRASSGQRFSQLFQMLLKQSQILLLGLRRLQQTQMFIFPPCRPDAEAVCNAMTHLPDYVVFHH